MTLRDIKNTAPIFKPVFGNDWDNLPPVLKKHYANTPYSLDETIVTGKLKIESSFIGKLFIPLFMMLGTLVPREGKDIPTTVRFLSDVASNTLQFNRTFQFAEGKTHRFLSKMKPYKNDEVIEFMRFGIGWHMVYHWTGEKITLTHKRYVWEILGLHIPLPMGFILGKGYAEEIAIDDNHFSMMMEIRHPWWGKVYGYSGTFKVEKEA